MHRFGPSSSPSKSSLPKSLLQKLSKNSSPDKSSPAKCYPTLVQKPSSKSSPANCSPNKELLVESFWQRAFVREYLAESFLHRAFGRWLMVEISPVVFYQPKSPCHFLANPKSPHHFLPKFQNMVLIPSMHNLITNHIL